MYGGSHRPTSFSWLSLEEANGESNFGVGGIITRAKAAVSLLVGDYVFFTNSGLGIVSKSATITNYNPSRMGIVVGGDQTFDAVVQEDNAIGILAANVNERVIVCTFGICKAYADAGLGITNQFIPSATTAGRIHNGTTAGQVGGVILETVGAAGPVRVFVRPA